jgi:acyl-CoA reductase-like NAD-dependent aldehyde dehydrogenase
MMYSYKLLIEGQLIDGASEIDVINPATGEILARCPRADEAILNRAVAAAKAAFPAWAKRPHKERQTIVAELAIQLEKRAEDFARLLVREQGKPIFLARYEMMKAVEMLRYFSALELPVKTLRDEAGSRIVEHRTPLGVVAAITPWNFPMLLLMAKLVPGLTAGNTMILKPAPTTPLTTCLLGEICAAIFPAGVVNVLVDQNDLGALLSSHPDVAKIAFTGSTATGRKVMASAAATIKRITLELGGNDAALVLDDADPKAVAGGLFKGAMSNAGQICFAVKRAYVHDLIYDDVCTALAALAESAIVDDGFAQGVQFGPLQNRAQYERVLDLLESARSEGNVIAGGNAIDRPGYFIRPTIVRDIGDDARIVKEEQFGPILPVLRYSDVDDAIRRVNDTEYGLGASVWGRDADRAYEIAQRIDAGTVWINKVLEIPLEIPFRGAKQSGLGTEFGQEGFEEYTQGRVINMALEHSA